MRDRSGASGGAGADEITENLRSDAGDAAIHRRVLESLIGVDPVLRRLHGHAVVDAVARIEPKGRRSLEARAQRDEDVLRYIAGLQSNRLSAGLIDIHEKRGLVVGLLDVNVDG